MTTDATTRVQQRINGRTLLSAVVAFYLVALAASGGFGLLQPLTGLDPDVLQLTQLGPAVAALIVLTCSRRVRALVTPGLIPRGSGAWRAALTGGVVLLGWAVLSWAGGATLALLRASSLPVGLPLLVVAQLVGALAEELGWRGLLLPVLRQRFPIATASAIVGLLWGVWHVGIFTAGPVFVAGFLAATVAMSLIMGTVIERVGGDRLLVGGTFHLIANLGMLMIVVGGPDDRSTTVSTWCFAVAASAVAAFSVWRLGRQGRSRRTRVLLGSVDATLPGRDPGDLRDDRQRPGAGARG